jgi:WD40 repeat protein
VPSPRVSVTDGPPRYLIASGTQNYRDASDRLEQVPDELRRIIELFREYGFEEMLTGLRLDPAAQEFKADLEDWLTDKARDPEGVTVIYYTGHGFTTLDGHYLAFRDTVMGKVARAIETSSLITLVGPAPRVRRLLIMVDACESGAGLLDAVRRAAQAATWQLPWKRREGIYVLAATRPKEDAAQSAFVSAFVDAVRRTAETTGAEQEFLAFDVILDHLNEQLQDRGQQATAAQVPYGTGLLPIFGNPAYKRRAGAGRLQADELFTGRVRALEDLRAWLVSTDLRPRVVTGDPGSGKSALLAHVAAETERVVLVSALKRTSQGLIADLAAAAGQIAATMSEFVASVPDGTMIAVDGLDEAVQPYDVMTAVLAPLAEQAGRKSVRLLIASRRPFHNRLPFAAEVIDLDTPRYYERADVREFVTALLVSPAIDGPATGAIAAVIAEHAGHSFLLARGAALAVRSQDRFLSPGEVAELMAGWEGAGAAFDADLEQRFGGAAARVRDLLAPLAWSYGPGLPWENIWADAATALSDEASYDDADIRWVLDEAYSYLRESVDEGRSVYRLFHAELARHLRGDRDTVAVNRRLTELLIRHVPTYGGRREWQAAHPYVRRHLAEHAAAGGMLDDLVMDPGFILAAAGPGLTRSVRSVTTPEARTATTTYLRAADKLVAGRTNDAERAAYLEFTARQDGNENLAQATSQWTTGSPWRARWARWDRLPASRVLVRAGKTNGLVLLNGMGDPLVAVATGDGRYPIDRDVGTGRVAVHDFWTGETVFAADLEAPVWSLTSAVIGGEALLLAGDARGRLHIWRATDWEQVRVFQAHSRRLEAAWGGEVAGRPVLITGGRSAGGDGEGRGEVTVWDPRSWMTVLGPVPAFDGRINHVDVLLLERPVILVSGDPLHEPRDVQTTVRAFDLETGAQRLALPMSQTILASALSLPRPRGRFVRSTDGTVELWDAAGPRCLHSTSTRGHFEHATATVSTRLGDLLAVPRGETIELYELETLRLVVTMRGHGFQVMYLDAAEVDGRPFVVSAVEDEVRVWDLADVLPRELDEPLPPETVQEVTATCRHPRGILVAQGDGRLAALDLAAGHRHRSWAAPGQYVKDLVATPPSFGGSGRAFAVVNDTLVAADLTTPEPMRALDPDLGSIRFAGVACTTVDDRLVVGACGDDATVVLYDGETGRRMGVPLREARVNKSLYTMAFTTTEPRLVLAAGGNRHIVAWNLRQALLGHSIRVPLPDMHNDHVRAVATFDHPLGEFIVSAGDDRGVVVTDPVRGRGWRLDEAHADWILTVAVLQADFPVIATGSRDGYVGLWTLSAQRLAPLAMIAIGASVNSLYAADPGLLIVGTTSGAVALDVASPKPNG